MRIVNKKYILLGVIMFFISVVFIRILWEQESTGRVWFGVLALIFLVAILEYLVNPDIKTDKTGIKSYHKRIRWSEIKYIDNYQHEYFEEWLEENYNIDITRIEVHKLDRYKEEFLNTSNGIYIGFRNEELRLDRCLNLSDDKKIEIINQLNSMLSLYKISKKR